MVEKELEIGKEAVLAAMRMTKLIQTELSPQDTLIKKDRSPVTVADFASQAVICRILNRSFPDIPIVAEEDSDYLRKEENREILDKILYTIDRDDSIKRILDRDNLFDSIDLGRGSIGKRFWTLDPIDGTKGFLRGEQFAIALALVVEGQVRLGILGCPNFKGDGSPSHPGSLLSAVRGQGASMRQGDSEKSLPIGVSDITDPRRMRFVESYVSAHSNARLQEKIAENLELQQEPVRMDSQVKYGAVSAGDAEIYLRIPHPDTPDYREKIWDHAAGSVIVEEAGGVVTDIRGKRLDFGAGKTLKNNTGIVATVPAVHGRVLEAIEELRH